MARPIKVFSETEAKDLIQYFHTRSSTEGWSKAAIAALEQLNESNAAQLRSWIDTYLSKTGWSRIQAAMRQRKMGSCDVVTKISSRASDDLALLANAASMTKKEYLNVLSDWLRRDKTGVAAAKAFILHVKDAKEQRVSFSQ